MNLLSCIFTISIALILPISAAVWLSIKNISYLRVILLGAMTFTVFQILIRIPMIQLVLQNQQWYIVMNYTRPILAAMLLGGSAALFEIGGRYLVMYFFMRNRHQISDGIAFGIGHGGIEAILLVGVSALLNLIFQGGTENTALTFAAGAERMSAMIMQIAWSVMVLRSIRSKEIKWLILAFTLHAFTDTAIGIATLYRVALPIIEVSLGALAIIMLIFVLKAIKYERRVTL